MKKKIKRVPVLASSYVEGGKKTSSTKGQGTALEKVKVVKGVVNQTKTKMANWSGQNLTGGGHYSSAYSSSSYVGSGNSAGAFGDVPLYFALMNENNGGILYWPVNLKEKYEWYRYFYRTDPYVGAAIDLHLELPLSKIMLKMPKMKDEKKREIILKKYEKVCDNLKLFEKLKSILLEYLVIGNVFIFVEWDDEKKEWKKMLILPPEEVSVFKYPFSDYSRVEYKPEYLTAIMKKLEGRGLSDLKEEGIWSELFEKEEKKSLSYVPDEIIVHMKENDNKIILDTDPYEGDEDNNCGSFVYHMARNKHEYYDLGVSILERVLVPLLMKEHYKYTQLSLASRNMTPRNKIAAEGISPVELDELREQIDLSMMDPDYTVVTNYPWEWEQIGADSRLIDLQREYEVIEQQLFAGLGVTRELLTGEGMYSGNRITVEIMNTRYMLVRETLKNMIEENLFKPMAEVNGFFEINEVGQKIYHYPKLSFNRLTIRDNQEVFDGLFQLYQKGSLPVDIILELFNIDSDEVNDKLREDMFTVKDSTFNDMMRDIYSEVGRSIAENSDLAEKIAGYMTGPDGSKISFKKEGEEGGDEWNYEGGNSWDSEEEVSDTEESEWDKDLSEEDNETPEDNSIKDEDIEDVAAQVVDNVKAETPEVSEEEISKALDDLIVKEEATRNEQELQQKEMEKE